MAEYLKCPICHEFYNLKTKIPKYHECGGVCCSSCTQDPCPICKSPHKAVPQAYTWLTNYIEKYIILCKCGENTAIFIDGKTFLPLCSSCKKSFQQGVKLDENLFKDWINSIFYYFLEKLNIEGNSGLLSKFFEIINKSLAIKLEYIRIASQYIGNKAYCKVHLEKQAKFLDENLDFYCECRQELCRVDDSAKCKVLVLEFITRTGLFSRFLIEQVFRDGEFFVVKCVVEAKCYARKVKFNDICAICENRFSIVGPRVVECKVHDRPWKYFICKGCMPENTPGNIPNQKNSFLPCFINKECKLDDCGPANVEFSSHCSNCRKEFLVEYEAAFEQQLMVPYHLVCDHNICKVCADKSQNNLIFCKICSQYYKFQKEINFTLLESIQSKLFICSDHKLEINTFSFYNFYKFFCEKCMKEQDFDKSNSPNEISLSWLVISSYFLNYISVAKDLKIINSIEKDKLKKTSIKIEMYKQLSSIKSRSKVTESGNINISTNETLSINNSEILIRCSRSIFITEINFTCDLTDIKLKLYKVRELSSKPIFFSLIKMIEGTRTFSLRSQGCIPLLKNTFYILEIIDFEWCDGLRLLNEAISIDGEIKLEINLHENSDSSGFSVVKSFEYEIRE